MMETVMGREIIRPLVETFIELDSRKEYDDIWRVHLPLFFSIILNMYQTQNLFFFESGLWCKTVPHPTVLFVDLSLFHLSLTMVNV